MIPDWKGVVRKFFPCTFRELCPRTSVAKKGTAAKSGLIVAKRSAHFTLKRSSCFFAHLWQKKEFLGKATVRRGGVLFSLFLNISRPFPCPLQTCQAVSRDCFSVVLIAGCPGLNKKTTFCNLYLTYKMHPDRRLQWCNSITLFSFGWRIIFTFAQFSISCLKKRNMTLISTNCA